MTIKIIMNSTQLRKKFKHIYADFFSRSMTAVSAPHSFLWSGDFSGFYGGLTISSKIPLRMYVGLEEIPGQENEIADQAFAYFAERDSFNPIQVDPQLRQAILEVLRGKISGRRIHILTEVPLGASVGGLGALAACLAVLIHAASGEKTNKPDGLFPYAWKIAKKLQTGRSLGATAYAALSDSKYPIVFYAEADKFWAKPLDKIAGLNKTPVWPIDFGLIFSGKYVQGAAVVASAEEVKRISEERETKLDFRRITKSPFWEDYINFLKQITNQNLYAMTDLFKKGAHENTLRYFFNTLNQYQNLLHFLEISNPEIDRIYSSIHSLANISDNRVGSGAKITGVGKGGMVLFATAYGQYREQIEKRFGNSLIYASWREGSEEQGTVLEQSIEKKIFSSFMSDNAYLLTIYTNDSIRRSLVSSSEMDNIDLEFIVDNYRQKIIIPGKNLSSKDIPSQKSTAIILSKLLLSPKRQLENNELPGSYATSRFDLQSKITHPVGKLSGIDFEISGGMYDDFVLKLKRLNKPVGVLEKL